MSDELEQLSDLASRALAAETRRPDVSDELAVRLMARVTSTVATGAAATAAKSGAAAKVATSAKAAQLGLTAKAAPWIGLAFLAGGGTGAAVHAALTVPAPRVVESSAASPSASVDRPVPPVVSAPPVESAVATRSSVDAPANVAPLRTAAAVTASSTAYEPDVSLAAERALVERARTALGRGDLEGALEAADVHAARYPKGRLQEEREAIAIQALAKLHRTADAERRAQAFRKAHANSVFLPTIDLVVP
ncbi:hypothetical protein AKJ09_06615 [Labilithrix luteola]|uniref:Uncharacterized protein n=1 Tax=Labilithrix luteola TaxID=1391654 RepID=A0A0K1Q2T3_9BACT|nr:hypothetical protein [Labilithrix luteola]AKU99951.1 hypothetical protein AKJ09_06615 [Labilithrix luteola]